MPDLIFPYGQRYLGEIEDIAGTKVRSKNVNDIRYADATILMADSVEKLQ